MTRRVTSIPALLQAVRVAKSDPTATWAPDWCTQWSASDLIHWFRRCLHRKISHQGSSAAGDPRARYRKYQDDYQLDLRVDAATVNGYARGIRNTGCRNTLRTPELRRLYPHVSTQRADYEDYR
jgi:hypothetical protein